MACVSICSHIVNNFIKHLQYSQRNLLRIEDAWVRLCFDL